uniref:Uncharacterized protein n=1 Tax=Candidatus Kentrum sp. MB TaxID=2138164 RepID=A0A450X4A6_9GAMM|nr:MAG: protein of unknown function (DUF4469) with IG-like fold [Candidatus Kentron sp. MB]VFK30515.1 MAG: protein of unknown function (DUF4469) with IG-like fold [Candidatus Kentron sp. MB]VFK75282.1 MAG: protein of unknown function (DUF4469) with IG-like fold [Candidatus Kentron sp. MB]
MTIHYTLIESHLATTEANTYTARIQAADTIDLEDVIQYVTGHGSKWTAEDIRAVLGEVSNATNGFLQNGQRVNLGFCELYPRITGTFQGITDHFDPARHRVDVGARPGAKVREAVRANAHVTKDETIKPTPTPTEYLDAGSGDVDGALTPGNIGTLNGHRLKYDPDKKDEGIFLLLASKSPADKTDEATAGESRITVIQKNKPSQLVFLVPPNLAKGGYYLEVRARIQGGEELRAGRLDHALTV